MKNTISFTKFIGALGCDLRLGYYWSAISKDRRRVALTIWDDLLINGEYVLIPTDSVPWMKLPGAGELKRHIPVAMTEGVEVLGVLCHASDPKATPRKRAYYDEKSLLVLKVEQRPEGTVAIVVGEADAEVAKHGKIVGLTTDRKSAVFDLDDIPPGVETPEKTDAFGSTFKRDRMVRDYVRNRANGRCEFCGEDGFLMKNGQRYVEAHHIIALGSAGADTVANVIALCPQHHREAHFGVGAAELNLKMLEMAKRLAGKGNGATNQ